MMELIRAERLNRRSDVSGTGVFVVPCEQSGHSDFPSGVPGLFVREIRTAKKSRERLHAVAFAENGALSAWRNLANNRRGIPDLRRVIGRVLKQLHVPIVKITIRTIARLRRSDIGDD